MMRSEGTHTKLIINLEHLVRKKYPLTIRNMPYPYFGKEKGEIDLVGIKKADFWDIYEVKSTDNYRNRHHALNQLKRARQFLQDYEICENINGFYYAVNKEIHKPEIILEQVL